MPPRRRACGPTAPRETGKRAGCCTVPVRPIGVRRVLEPLTQGGSSRLQTGRRREGGGVDVPKGSEELTNARKEEIVSACAALYETMGFKDITLREIGEKTSFTRTSIYNYFQTKEEIFLAPAPARVWGVDRGSGGGPGGGRPPCRQRASPPTGPHPGKGGGACSRLMSMNLYDMEGNSRMENLVAFKRVYAGAMGALTGCLEKFFPACRQAISRSFSTLFSRSFSVSIPIPLPPTSRPGHGAGPGGISPLFHL